MRWVKWVGRVHWGVLLQCVAICLQSGVFIFMLGSGFDILILHTPLQNHVVLEGSSWWQSFRTGSLLCMGSVFGLLLSGWLFQKISRKKSLIVAVIPGLLGWISIGLTLNTSMLFFGRWVMISADQHASNTRNQTYDQLGLIEERCTIKNLP